MHDFGIILSVQDGVAVVSGLKRVSLTELVLFKKNILGMALSLEKNVVRICLMGADSQVNVGDIVHRTKRYIKVPCGHELLGRIVDSLGRPVDGKGPLKKPISNENQKQILQKIY